MHQPSRGNFPRKIAVGIYRRREAERPLPDQPEAHSPTPIVLSAAWIRCTIIGVDETRGPGAVLPPESGVGGEEDPSEIKEFVQELGIGGSIGLRPPPVPPAAPLVQFLGILACGAIATAGAVGISLGSLADTLAFKHPLGQPIQ